MLRRAAPSLAWMAAMMTKTAFRTQKEENEAHQDQAKDAGNKVVDEHRELEIDRFLAVRVDLGGVAALQEPDEERRGFSLNLALDLALQGEVWLTNFASR